MTFFFANEIKRYIFHLHLYDIRASTSRLEF